MSVPRIGARNALKVFGSAQSFKISAPATCRCITTEPPTPTADPPKIAKTFTDSSLSQSAAVSFAMSMTEQESALATPPPQDRKSLRKLRRFNPRGRAIARRYELPGARFVFESCHKRPQLSLGTTNLIEILVLDINITHRSMIEARYIPFSRFLHPTQHLVNLCPDHSTYHVLVKPIMT